MAQQNHILAPTNYTVFCAQLEEVVSKYPNLAIKSSECGKYLKGIVDVPSDKGDVVGSFLIEIHFTSKFPYRFPKVLETGGVIPCEADWHKYTDESLCLTVEAEEILICKAGITLTQFLTNQVIPFFANHIHRKENGTYKNGDYGHGATGTFEFYATLLKTEDIEQWVDYFEFVFRSKTFQNDRNLPCFCGSPLKFKNCHKLIFNSFREIGEEQVIKDFKNINKQ